MRVMSGSKPTPMIDPGGAMGCSAENSYGACGGSVGFWGGGDFDDDAAKYNSTYGGLSANISRGLLRRNLIDDKDIGYDIELDRFNDGTKIRQEIDGVVLNINASGWSMAQVQAQYNKFNKFALEIKNAARREVVRTAITPLANNGIIKIVSESGVGFKFRVLDRNKFRAFLDDSANKFKNGLLSPFHVDIAECGSFGKGCVDYRSDPGSAAVISGSMQITFNQRKRVGFVDIDRFSPFHSPADFARHVWFEVINGDHGVVVRPPSVLDAVHAR